MADSYEVRTKVQSVRVSRKHAECGGLLEYRNLQSRGLYGHACSECRASVWLYEQHPRIEYEEIDVEESAS